MAVTKLELTWVGKDEPMQKIEPRLLLHHKEKSYGETGTGICHSVQSRHPVTRIQITIPEGHGVRLI